VCRRSPLPPVTPLVDPIATRLARAREHGPTHSQGKLGGASWMDGRPGRIITANVPAISPRL